MEGTEVPQETDCTFEWDENSQLYYHASTGFYHDPQAGWYYSSRDGHYYQFENGNYQIIEPNQVDAIFLVYSSQSEDQTETLDTNCEEDISETKMAGGEISVESSQAPLESNSIDDESQYPPPPSEWLEDTLIDMYLSGYSNRNNSTATSSDTAIPAEINETENLNASANDDDDDSQELEEGEWIPDDPAFLSNLREHNIDEGLSAEEENWRSQYGQVSQSSEGSMSDFQAIELWDWSLVREKKKNGKTDLCKLVGKLMNRTNKLHPSVPSGGRTLKTASVCDVHFDLVRVKSGRIYRLRIPSLQYLTSLSVYDASNPTKDWDFPQLSINNIEKKCPKYNKQTEAQSLEVLDVQKDKFLPPMKLPSHKKDPIYRDRASERRSLHGGFGVGPGQKNNSLTCDDSDPSSPTLHLEEALSKSFGEGSYARKILQNMGWKEGDSLGCSMKGLTQPLQAVGNKGNAGLGWKNGMRKE